VAGDGCDDRDRPGKGSYTAVVVSGAGGLRVRAGAGQAGQLIGWAAAWPGRRWAVENGTGLGPLLAHLLAGAGERVLGIRPRLAARVRVLEAGTRTRTTRTTRCRSRSPRCGPGLARRWPPAITPRSCGCQAAVTGTARCDRRRIATRSAILASPPDSEASRSHPMPPLSVARPRPARAVHGRFKIVLWLMVGARDP
jgi:hypothetical protein